MAGLTRQLAGFVVQSEWTQLPASVRREGLRAFVNIVGCMLGGCREASVEAALAAFAPFAGPPQATVIGRGLRLDLPRAALVNGLASSQHAYNDTHLRTVAHPTGPTLAPLLALAEHETLSGAQLLHALVLGIEVQCRVGLMLVTPPAEAAVGLSTQGVLGALGAAAAAGKALGLDEQRMVWAIGIASALAAGHRETHATMAGHLVPANAARAGLEAALLAAAGFTCGEAALEGEKGFARVYAREPNAAAALDGLGARWEIEALTYKPYPCGIVIHPLIDACLDLARGHDIDPRRIERIQFRVSPLAMALTGGRKAPRNAQEAGVSLHHWAAAALVRRAAGLAEAAEDCVHDPAVAALRARVAAVVDPAMADDATDAVVTLEDGGRLARHVAHCRGSRDNPMSDDDLAAKFRGLAETALGEAAAAAVLGECWKLDGIGDVGTWLRRSLAGA